MDYRQTLDYLYTMLPMFTRIGAAAYKKDLTNTLALCEALGNPQHKFKSIHIAGSNGKGSTSHFMSAILQEAGYKTGLYTSPHLVDFRERIRVNGQMASEAFVVDFTQKVKPLIEKIQPSFFELTVAMAFEYFVQQGVEIAVIETGLGGRLDSTNVILPELSIITNISYDHQNLLGETLREIAGEKAGIIKQDVPVVIGEWQEETAPVFEEKAKLHNSTIYFAEDVYQLTSYRRQPTALSLGYKDKNGHKINLNSPLPGLYQAANIASVLTAVQLLNSKGWHIGQAHISQGIAWVKSLTGLRGRWEILQESPLIICDVAHNEAGLKAVFRQLNEISHTKLRIVYGMVKDKDIKKALALLPANAQYYFSQPALPRALAVEELMAETRAAGLQGERYACIAEAYNAAKRDVAEGEILLVTGSIFVVAEVLSLYPALLV